jgi:hypothetical protein
MGSDLLQAFQDLPQAECLERFNTQWIFQFLAAKGTTFNMKKLKENPSYAASKDTQVT